VLAVTISRLENLPDVRALLRLGRALIEQYCASFRQVPKRIVLDIDDTPPASSTPAFKKLIAIMPSPSTEQHTGERARLVSACAGVARGGIGGKLLLNRIPQRLIDDRRVFAEVGLSLVNDLAAIKAVLQHQVERAGRSADRARQPTHPALRSPSIMWP
jgi:hypothetical protein